MVQTGCTAGTEQTAKQKEDSTEAAPVINIFIVYTRATAETPIGYNCASTHANLKVTRECVKYFLTESPRSDGSSCDPPEREGGRSETATWT